MRRGESQRLKPKTETGGGSTECNGRSMHAIVVQLLNYKLLNSLLTFLLPIPVPVTVSQQFLFIRIAWWKSPNAKQTQRFILRTVNMTCTYAAYFIFWLRHADVVSKLLNTGSAVSSTSKLKCSAALSAGIAFANTPRWCQSPLNETNVNYTMNLNQQIKNHTID